MGITYQSSHTHTHTHVMQPKHTLSGPEVQVRAFLSIYSIFVLINYYFAENFSKSDSKFCMRCGI